MKKLVIALTQEQLIKLLGILRAQAEPSTLFPEGEAQLYGFTVDGFCEMEYNPEQEYWCGCN